MDVKFLRTAVRHDVDHGSTSDVAKKMKRAGETFRKYSNKFTPDECGADELLEVQSKLLRKFLEVLKTLASGH
jgi:hypothetical protein